MLGAIFDLAIRAVPGNQIGNEFLHRREIMRINVAAKFLADQILGLVTENIKDLRTYERISRFGVKRDDQIGETIHQAARKFLFTMQATLHFTLLGDVHKCALITHKFARGIADDGCGVQGNDFAGILPVLESHFASAQESEIIELGALPGAVGRILVKRRKFRMEDFFLPCEPEHLGQGRIHFRNTVINGGQINAFP